MIVCQNNISQEHYFLFLIGLLNNRLKKTHLEHSVADLGECRFSQEGGQRQGLNSKYLNIPVWLVIDGIFILEKVKCKC